VHSAAEASITVEGDAIKARPSLAETQDAVIGKQKGGAVAREPASLPQEVKEAITRVYGYESTHIARFCPNLSGKLAQQTKP
jgi:hypothetical protein